MSSYRGTIFSPLPQEENENRGQSVPYGEWAP